MLLAHLTSFDVPSLLFAASVGFVAGIAVSVSFSKYLSQGLAKHRVDKP